jgi:DNA ligase (NAD+)
MLTKPTDISKYFNKLSLEDLQQISDIGPAVAESIHEWFHDQNNLDLLGKLEGSGIEIEIAQLLALSSQFQGKTFVLTGELEKMSRDEAKEKVRRLGGNISSSVSKNTDFVVVGKNPGSKYDKARELGVKIIGEEEFLKMIK